MAYMAFGTQVYAREDGSVVVVPPEVKYEPAAGERRIAEVVNIRMEFNVDSITRAIIECYPNQDTILIALKADYLFKAKHEATPRTISFVQFEDGTTWYPDSAKAKRDLLHKFLDATGDLPKITVPPNNGRPRKIDGALKAAMDYTQPAENDNDNAGSRGADL
jgi:hypothetical protein